MIGTWVTHKDRAEIGMVNRVVIGADGYWFRVTWPSGIGNNALYRSSVLVVV